MTRERPRCEGPSMAAPAAFGLATALFAFGMPVSRLLLPADVGAAPPVPGALATTTVVDFVVPTTSG